MKSSPAALAEALLNLVDLGTASPLLLIDGRAGAGKSTLAAEVRNHYFRIGESSPRIIHMDALYPGWQGLAEGVDYLGRMILRPLSLGKSASWQEWDWQAGERSGLWREFSGGTPLIVEGCGCLNQFSAPLAQLRVWLEVDAVVRRERWLAREGNDDYFALWAAQEDDFYAREKSRELAD